MLDFYAFANKVLCFEIAKMSSYLVTVVYEKIAKVAINMLLPGLRGGFARLRRGRLRSGQLNKIRWTD